jgi:lipopolysaccharide biosynthesis glycosyltransferase
MNTKAIVTLAIGDKYFSLFKNVCAENWQQYADTHGYDIIVFDKPLDNSIKAQSRSPAWQKCLILSQPELQKYDQVVWLDSDILINPHAPCVCESLSDNFNIAAADSYGMFGKENYSKILQANHEKWKKAGIPFINNPTPKDYHKNWGFDDSDLLPIHKEYVVQTGVIVLSPHFHKHTLKYVYNCYEDKGGAVWNYEMPPLSYELLKNHECEWLDWKFNAIVGSMKENGYENIEKMLDDSYFLHFAGCQNLMAQII